MTSMNIFLLFHDFFYLFIYCTKIYLVPTKQTRHIIYFLTRTTTITGGAAQQIELN